MGGVKGTRYKMKDKGFRHLLLWIKAEDRTKDLHVEYILYYEYICRNERPHCSHRDSKNPKEKCREHKNKEVCDKARKKGDTCKWTPYVPGDNNIRINYHRTLCDDRNDGLRRLFHNIRARPIRSAKYANAGEYRHLTYEEMNWILPQIDSDSHLIQSLKLHS